MVTRGNPMPLVSGSGSEEQRVARAIASASSGHSRLGIGSGRFVPHPWQAVVGAVTVTRIRHHSSMHLELLMRARTLALALALAFPGRSLVAQAPADSAAIRATALDYVEGWYEGNPARMERSLHPELAKRIVRVDSTGKASMQQMGATALVAGVRAGYGRQTPKDRQVKTVRILDVFGNTASVRADMADWVDYMQMAKVEGRWVIVNVLWEMRPRS